jgi:hypothetical protein
MPVTFDAWLTRLEILPLVVRSLGVVVAAISGVLGIKIFLDVGGDAGPYLVAMVSWLVFLPLMQFGLGRPLYGVLRRDYIGNGGVEAQLSISVMIFAGLSIFAICVFAGFAAWLLKDSLAPLKVFEYSVLAAGLAASSSGAFQRDYCYAISRELLYESCELVRRCSLLCGLFALWLNLDATLVGLALIASAVITQAFVARQVLRIYETACSLNSLVAVLRDVRLDACRFFLFSINEILLYNLPLVYFTLVNARDELVFFGVWTRLFQAVVLPMRMLIDARVNRKTASYHAGNFSTLREDLKVSVLIAMLSVMVLLAALALIIEPLVHWLGADELVGASWMGIGLATWCIGNAVQHVYGTFIVSYGLGFAFALKASAVSTIISALIFFVAMLLNVSVGPALALMGAVYALTAILYRNEIYRLISCGARLQ